MPNRIFASTAVQTTTPATLTDDSTSLDSSPGAIADILQSPDGARFLDAQSPNSVSSSSERVSGAVSPIGPLTICNLSEPRNESPQLERPEVERPLPVQPRLALRLADLSPTVLQQKPEIEGRATYTLRGVDGEVKVDVPVDDLVQDLEARLRVFEKRALVAENELGRAKSCSSNRELGKLNELRKAKKEEPRLRASFCEEETLQTWKGESKSMAGGRLRRLTSKRFGNDEEDRGGGRKDRQPGLRPFRGLHEGNGGSKRGFRGLFGVLGRSKDDGPKELPTHTFVEGGGYAKKAAKRTTGERGGGYDATTIDVSAGGVFRMNDTRGIVDSSGVWGADDSPTTHSVSFR